MDLNQLPADVRERIHERAAIMEYDGGLSRAEAEKRAVADVLERMRKDGEPCRSSPT